MSNLRNRVQLIGHLGANPEIKTVNNGSKVVRLRIATNESYKTSSGEWKESTQWHNIDLWDKLAERAETQMKKGSYVMVEGKLVNRDYVDASRQKKYITEVRAFNVLLLDKKVSNKLSTPEPFETQAEESDLPF